MTGNRAQAGLVGIIGGVAGRGSPAAGMHSELLQRIPE